MVKGSAALEAALNVIPEPEQAAAAATSAASIAKTLRSTGAKDAVVQAGLRRQLMDAPKVPVTLAPQYRAYFGDVMTVSLNGIAIYVPVDGRTRQVPKQFAIVINERRRRIDDFLLKAARLADIQNNAETFAGELKF